MVDGDLHATVALLWLVAVHCSADRLGCLRDHLSVGNGNDTKAKDKGSGKSKGRDASKEGGADATRAVVEAGERMLETEKDDSREGGDEAAAAASEAPDASASASLSEGEEEEEEDPGFESVAEALEARKKSVRRLLKGARERTP